MRNTELYSGGTSAHHAEIESVISDYFQGMYRRDIARLRKAFHPSARLFGHLEGSFVEMSLEHWLEKVQGRPIPADSAERFDMSIVSIEITGHIASAKVRDFYRGLQFTDDLHLARTGAQWQIVNKTFHHD